MERTSEFLVSGKLYISRKMAGLRNLRATQKRRRGTLYHGSTQKESVCNFEKIGTLATQNMKSALEEIEHKDGCGQKEMGPEAQFGFSERRITLERRRTSYGKGTPKGEVPGLWLNLPRISPSGLG
jgi:hypothetical protein